MRLMEVVLEDETLWEDEWIAVKSVDGWYTYTHSVKSEGKGVAVLGYAEKDGQTYYLGRFENTPCHHDGIALASLTGMVEKGDHPQETAIKELKEESGVDADLGDLQDLGITRPSKSSDTTIYLFAVRLDYQDGKLYGEGDGSKGEEGAYCMFIPRGKAVNAKDPGLATMIARFEEL